jgi:phosphoglycolate phosphatase-like HAD superfamily hydrolase
LIEPRASILEDACNTNLSYHWQVGDSIDDMTSGHAAGAATVLLVNERNSHLREHAHTDLCITRLDELIDILEGGFLGREGQDVHEP